MKLQLLATATAALSCATLCALADTPYPQTKENAAANRAKVEDFRENAYWKGAPIAAAAVDPLSGVRRTPDLFPEDGDFTGPVRTILAKDEYEGASFVLYGFRDVEDVTVKVNVAGLEADVKTVKVWYQQGTAWGSFFSDPTRRIATPELLLHDDALIHTDFSAQENYVRCDYSKGDTAYRWVSFSAAAVNHTYDMGIRNEWIHDAPALRPFTVRANEFKQLMVTFHADAKAAAGIHAGTIDVLAGGKRLFAIPCEVRVLPFTLPLPATYRDPKRPFMAVTYIQGPMTPVSHEKIAKNMVAHNMRNAMLPQLDTPTKAKEAYERFKRTGFDTKHLFCALPGCGLVTSTPVKPTDKNYDKFVNATNVAARTMRVIREVFGPDAKAYSYGIDEGSAWTVRAERETWKGIHRAGGNTVVATQYHPYILFNLDFATVPRHPRTAKKAKADAFHAGNPDALMGWYADPHSGPENPDYTRRIYGWQTWRNNYDCSCQYCLYRDNWNDFWVPDEPFLRGLMLVYPQDGDLLDTIEWEGLREGMDDIRYTTLLRELAEKARLSKTVETAYAGRAALTWVAQVDCEHSELDYLRLETIRRILDLQERLGTDK